MIVLSDGESDVLKKIVGYGGYCTKEILHLYRKDISSDRCYRILRQLESKKYLVQREHFESIKQPGVFQVTRKACSLYGRPESYMRKKHKPFEIRRYLMRTHYLFTLAGNGQEVCLGFSDEREKYLLSLGISKDVLPVKINKGTAKVHIEEYIRILSDDSIELIYFDNHRYSVNSQLKFLITKYSKLENAHGAFFSFLVVTEEEYKAKLFKDIFNDQYYREITEAELKSLSINRSYLP